MFDFFERQVVNSGITSLWFILQLCKFFEMMKQIFSNTQIRSFISRYWGRSWERSLDPWTQFPLWSLAIQHILRFSKRKRVRGKRSWLDCFIRHSRSIKVGFVYIIASLEVRLAMSVQFYDPPTSIKICHCLNHRFQDNYLWKIKTIWNDLWGEYFFLNLIFSIEVETARKISNQPVEIIHRFFILMFMNWVLDRAIIRTHQQIIVSLHPHQFSVLFKRTKISTWFVTRLYNNCVCRMTTNDCRLQKLTFRLLTL